MKLFAHALLVLASAAAVAGPSSGLDSSTYDNSVRPQDDLFRAVNGSWLKNTPIPGDKAAYGAFHLLADRSDERVRALVESLAAQKDATGNAQKIGAFWRSYMDLDAIEKAGLSPVQPWLKDIDAIKDRHQLAVMLGRMQGMFGTPLPLAVEPDAKDPGTHLALSWQGGLGLPDRDYYLKDDARYVKAREAYLAYLQTLLRLSGARAPAEGAKQVYALERRLAESQWKREDLRDPQKTYNPTETAKLVAAARGFDWPAFFDAAAMPGLKLLSVSQPGYAQAFAQATEQVPLSTWKTYLRVRVLEGGADVLPKAFRDAEFAFNGKAIKGLTEEEPRWQKATAALDKSLGEAVGQLYVERHFPPAYKARMQELVGNLLAAYRESIDGLTWMTPETKKRAQEKLARYHTKIGYPERWRSYEALAVRDGDAFGNAARGARFDFERIARRAGRAVDRGEWEMTPQTVNAYYHPNFNEIVFPAAILEPPFFDMAADDAVNYGAIGAIIGHEISHGFDDYGSQFDGGGKLANWWTEADRKAFEALGDKLVAQYGAYEPISGHKLNGRLTLGENIADLSGLQIAYKAYKLSLKGQAAPVIDGMSGEQRFFYGWGQAWREKRRDERELQLLTIDSHSPPRFRANGAAVNHDGFHETFATKPGDGMYKAPAERVRIW